MHPLPASGRIGVSRHMLKIISWNIARRELAWRSLLDSGADVALLQEATEPPSDVAQALAIDPAPWRTAGTHDRPWRTAIVRLSERADVQWLEVKSVDDARSGELAVSRLGTLTAAVVTPTTGLPVTVASMYAPWERPHGMTGSTWIYADASVHRVISDLSLLIGREQGHRLIAAGDLNILHGYGEHGNDYWASRYNTVFARMTALGVPFVGPQTPAGRPATPWPDELPATSKNVPTYHTNRQEPSTATRQLDFVFASDALGEQIDVRALNEPDHWGPSDHCRVEITVGCD